MISSAVLLSVLHIPLHERQGWHPVGVFRLNRGAIVTAAKLPKNKKGVVVTLCFRLLPALPFPSGKGKGDTLDKGTS